MITFQSELNIEIFYPLHIPYRLEDILLFDIETTGLSAKTSFLYLIGCIYYQNKTWHMIQWLADDLNSEAAILDAFSERLQNCSRLIHYNGSSFDIPYLLQKLRQHNLPDRLTDKESFDIYKKIIPYKKYLPIPNYKLKTLETFLNMKRKDTYTGEQLIQVYSNYLGRLQYEKLHQINQNNNIISDNNPHMMNKTSESNKPCSEELLSILLLHNAEDVKGLFQISDILYYTYLFENNTDEYTVIENKLNQYEWLLHIQLSYFLPESIYLQTPFGGLSLKLQVEKNHLILQIPVYHGVLKYFYSNYKDYFYLPKEDIAIHKNVAQYVDREYRIKAKASNCYTKQSGYFLPQMSDMITPSFKYEYNDKISFIESSNPLLTKTNIIQEYIHSFIQYVILNKETKLIS